MQQDIKDRSVVSEKFRTLRTNIMYSSYDNKIKRILITSSEPDEGKTTVSTNLAIVMSKDNKKVILIDCDLRRPKTHKAFEISNKVGLSDLIVGKTTKEEAIYNYSENMDILTAGKVSPNPSELLGSNKMEQLLDELDEKYDIIILDSPPVHAVTDSQILSRKVDGVIVVVRAKITKRDSVKAAVKQLKMVGANIIGTVLNGEHVDDENYNYYYKYQQKRMKTMKHEKIKK